MKKCKFCGAELPLEASFCHKCAKSLLQPQEIKPPKTKRKWPIAAASAAIIAIAALLLWPKAPAEPASDDAARPAEISAADITPEASAASQPTPEATPESGKVYTAENAFIQYRSGEDVYNLLACHSRTPDNPNAGEYSQTHEIAPGQTFYSSALLYVFKDGKSSSRDFLALTESINADIIPLSNSKALEPGDCMCSESHPDALYCRGYFFNDLSYSNAIDWEIRMKNGDVIQLRQEVHVSTVDVAEFHFEDHPMNTLEELKDLLDWIYSNVDPNTDVDIYLPPVIYDGGLELNIRGVNFYGSYDNNTDTGTSFTGPVRVSAFGPALCEICGVSFIGNGESVGLWLGCALVAQDCVFRNWGTGVYVGNDAWLINWRNSFIDNDVGMEISNPSGSQIVNTDFMGCLYEGNALAFRLTSCFTDDNIKFIDCVFIDNEVFSENLSTAGIDTSRSTFQ